MQIKIPKVDKFGEVKPDGNGGKLLKLNIKFISLLTGLIVLGFGVLTGATAWVIQQNDTTKTVRTLESKVDTLESMQVITQVEQTGSWEIQKLLLKKLDPENADNLIQLIEQQKKTLKEQLENKQKNNNTDIN